MTKSSASVGTEGKSTSIYMALRKPNGELNKTELNKIGRDFFNTRKRLEKTIKRGSAESIRKLNKKREEGIKKATTDAEKKRRRDILKKEKKKLQDDSIKAKEQLKGEKKKIADLLNRGVGVIFTSGGNLKFKDLLKKEDRNAMLRNLTIMTDANVSAEQLKRMIKKNEKRAEVFSQGLKRLRYRKHPPYRVDENSVAGGQLVNYLFDYDQLDEEFNFFDTLVANIKRTINNTRWRHPNARFQIRISTKKGNAVIQKTNSSFVDNRAFALPSFNKWSVDDVLDIFEDKFERAFEEYDEDEEYFDFQTIMISYLVPPTTNFGAGGHKTIQQAHKKWFITDTNSQSNCFYRSISFIRLMEDLDKDEDLFRTEKILCSENDTILCNLINDRAKNMKKRLEGATRKTTTEEDIQNWVDKMGKRANTYSVVKIYNNVFKLVKTIVPPKPPNCSPKTYEVWCYDHHFIPLVKWTKLINIEELCVKRAQMKIEQAEEKAEENELIDKKQAREIVDYDAFKKWASGKTDIDFSEVNEDDKKKGKLITKWEYIYKMEFCRDKDKVRNAIIPFNNKIAAYDIEATANGNNDIFKAYRISLAYNHGEKIRNVSFGGEDCITKFFDYLYKHYKIFDGYTFYGHNAGNFDLLILMKEYLLENIKNWTIEEESMIVLNGCYMNIEIDAQEPEGLTEEEKKSFYDARGNPPSIKFRDSFRLLPMGLEKLCNEFNVPHKKIGKDLEVDFSEINLDNCYGQGKHPPEKLFSTKDFFIDLSQRVYCDYDTIGLLECLNIFNKEIYEELNINMTGCLTGASLSKQNFFKNYYSKKHIPVYHMNREFDTFCRKGYCGGRCEAHYIGEWDKNCYYYDFTSLYPDVGRKRLPYGKPYKVDEKRIEKWNRQYNENKQRLPLINGMMKFLIKTVDFDALPIHGIKRNNKLIFPHFDEWTEITLWSYEFIYANSLDIYEYKLLDAIHFGEQMVIKRSERKTYWDEGFLKDFFEDAVSKKAIAKKNKKPALAQSYKIIANSGYGFWGLNANGDDGRGRDGMEIHNKNDVSLWQSVSDNAVNNIGQRGEYVLLRTTREMPVKDFNVAVASAISSYARIKIHKFMKAIRDVGGTLLYCDTDSCICDIRICDYPEIMEEFCWDGTGEALGSMKNEAEEKLEKYFVKKYGKSKLNECMEKQKKLDDGEFSFDKGIIAGCKQYCLSKKVYDGGYIEASASKGCKKDLTYEDFHHLLYGTKMKEQEDYEAKILLSKPEWKKPKGFRLYEEQTQFRSGLIEHMTEGEGYNIRIVSIDKSMRINYEKGIVANTIGADGISASGIVKPLIISQ